LLQNLDKDSGDPATCLFLPTALDAAVIRRDGRREWSVNKPDSLPDGATLLVQHRAPFPAFRLGHPSADRGTAIDALEEANSSLTFRTLRELKAGDPWSGAIEAPGTLRLCLTGGPALQVHAETLDPGS